MTVLTQRRVHQQSFRERVLEAYRKLCAICQLRHPQGEPIVPNGLALCQLHHAACDRHILGITPTLRVEVRLDILHEVDGPMLLHGLQGFQGAQIVTPRAAALKPRAEFLAERYELFRRAS